MRILIADEDPVARLALEATLVRWGYDVEVAEDGQAAWQMMANGNGPRMVVIEWLMDGVDGAELCRKLRAKVKSEYVYVLLMSTRDGAGELIEALDAGADDYIVKPFDSAELKARVRCGLRILQLQNDLVMAREALRDQATFDALTGAYNRGAIIDLLEREVSRAHRAGSPISLIMCDLDHFKQVNDAFGHQTGDQVLIEATARLHAGVRHYDFVGRYGGEEFVVVLPGCNAADATALADRLRQSLAGSVIDTSQGPVLVTASFGVGTYVGETDAPPGDAEALVRAADEALYAAKDAGRNRVIMGRSPRPLHDDEGARD